MDVTPLSLSIETVGGVATKIIDRNTTIPTRHSQVFSTAANYQTSVEIKVLQGERQFAKDNTLLGNFRLGGIKRAPAGVPQIEVTFDIDANGIVKVSAKDLGTGKQKNITITASSNLSEEEIERAIHDAEAYAGEDRSRKDKLDALHEAQSQMYAAEQYINTHKKELPKETKKEIRNQVALLQRLTRAKKPNKMKDEELAVIQEATAKLKTMISE